MQAFTYITDSEMEAGYLIRRGVKKAVKRGLFGFPHILKGGI
jgi:hypothetical protein